MTEIAGEVETNQLSVKARQHWPQWHITGPLLRRTAPAVAGAKNCPGTPVLAADAQILLKRSATPPMGFVVRNAAILRGTEGRQNVHTHRTDTGAGRRLAGEPYAATIRRLPNHDGETAAYVCRKSPTSEYPYVTGKRPEIFLYTAWPAFGGLAGRTATRRHIAECYRRRQLP